MAVRQTQNGDPGRQLVAALIDPVKPLSFSFVESNEVFILYRSSPIAIEEAGPTFD